MKIFINPGHGNKSNGVFDPGAVNNITGLREADINLAIGTLLNRKLQAVAETYLYQSGDINPISAAANNWNGDYFVSIHANSFSDVSAHGIETLYYPTSAKGHGLAKSVQAQLVKSLGRADRGIKPRSNLGVLRDTKMPAVLVEIGFISNSKEEELMKSSIWQENAAEALALGLCNYLGLTYSSSAPAEPIEPPSEVEKNEFTSLPASIIESLKNLARVVKDNLK